MKQFSFAVVLVLFSFTVHSSEKQVINLEKINGPECLTHLKKSFKFKASEAYQICSMKSEELKVCLIENRKLSQNELLKVCHKK